MAVLATQNLLTLMCTTTYQNLGEIGVTPNESNGPESNGPSAGVTLTKFVCGLNPMRTRWIRHFWIDVHVPHAMLSFDARPLAVRLERVPLALGASPHFVFNAGTESQKSVPIRARPPKLLSAARRRSRQFLHFTCVNRPGGERAVRRLVVGYLVPVLDRLFVRECAAGPYPFATDRNGDVSVRGHVDLMAQPRLGRSLQMSLHPLRRPLPPIDARAP